MYTVKTRSSRNVLICHNNKEFKDEKAFLVGIDIEHFTRMSKIAAKSCWHVLFLYGRRL